jgi:hypothetical protein
MDKKKQSKKIDPDGPLHKWGEPEGVTDYMKKTPGQKKVVEAKYSVDVEGLPRFYMDSDSPAKVKVALRKLLKKASSIDAVSRVPDATIKADLRQRLKTAETDKRYVDEKLDPRMGAGEYVKDFKKSDAPQFKGKSDKKKREMAIAAYLAARQEKAMEEERAWHKRDDEQKSKSKDHQTLNYTTRGGQKMKTAVHKDKAFGAVGHYRRMGHTDVHLEGYRDPFKAAARSAKYKELSHEYEREKQIRKQKAQKSASQNKSFRNVRSRMEEVEQVDEGAKHKKVAKDLQAYAKKHGGIDKDDFLMAAQLVGDGKMRDLKKFLRSMDTDPRDGVIQILRRNGIKEEVMNENKIPKVGESVDQVGEGMVNAVSTAKKYAGNVTKAVNKIDKMKSKKQGGDFSDNPRIQKKLRKYNEGMESWNEFLESSCGGSHKSKKKAVKEGKLSDAQKKHMDTDKDGDIDAVDLKNLRNKKKS